MCVLVWRAGTRLSSSFTTSLSPPLRAATVRLCSNGNRWEPCAPPITRSLRAPGDGAGWGAGRRQGWESRRGGRTQINFHTRVRKSQETTAVNVVTVNSDAAALTAEELQPPWHVSVGLTVLGRVAAVMERREWADSKQFSCSSSFSCFGLLPALRFCAFHIFVILSGSVWSILDLFPRERCLEKPNTTSLMMDTISGSRCTMRKLSNMGSTSRQRWVYVQLLFFRVFVYDCTVYITTVVLTKYSPTPKPKPKQPGPRSDPRVKHVDIQLCVKEGLISFRQTLWDCFKIPNASNKDKLFNSLSFICLFSDNSTSVVLMWPVPAAEWRSWLQWEEYG